MSFAAGLLAACGSSAPAASDPGPTGVVPTAAPGSPLASPQPSPGLTAAPASVPPETFSPPTAPPPTEVPSTAPAIVTWDVPAQEDCTGTTAGQITVKWAIKRATGVAISIDGPGIYQEYVGSSGEVVLPFGCDSTVLKHTYLLTTEGGDGPAATSVRVVKTRAPSIVSFSMGDAACVEGGDTYVGVSMHYEVRAATGVDLKRDGVAYTSYTAKAWDDIVMFDCREESQLFRITTTGGFGDPATQAIRVNNPLLQ